MVLEGRKRPGATDPHVQASRCHSDANGGQSPDLKATPLAGSRHRAYGASAAQGISAAKSCSSKGTISILKGTGGKRRRIHVLWQHPRRILGWA